MQHVTVRASPSSRGIGRRAWRQVAIGVAALLVCLSISAASAQVVRPDVRLERVPTARLSIADASVPWIRRADRVLTARVTSRLQLTPGFRVEVDYARHHWPGSAAAHTVVAAQSDDDRSLWIARPVRAAAALRGDSLFYRWRVSYQNVSRIGRPSRTTQTSISDAAPHEMTVDCRLVDTARDLQALQALALGFDRPEPYLSLAGSHPVPTHGQVSVRNIGYTLSSIGVAMMQTSVRIGPPALLFFRPRLRLIAVPGVRTTTPLESESAYNKRLADAFPDGPYRLAGWGYGEPQRDPRRRPQLGCVPSKHWFLHEAGYHLANGGFQATPPVPPERTPGAERILVPGDTPLAVVQPGGPPHFSFPRPVPEAWHPRIWDLHMWRDPRPACANGACPPLIQIESPEPIPGITFPANTFFRSQTFE